MTTEEVVQRAREREEHLLAHGWVRDPRPGYAGCWLDPETQESVFMTNAYFTQKQREA